MKKVLSLIMTVLMLASLIGAATLTASAAEDGYVWVVRSYDLKEANFTGITSGFFVRCWWQFWDDAEKKAAFDVTVKEVQLWVDDEMLETHLATGDSPIKVEGEENNAPSVTRNENGATVKKGTVCTWSQLQFNTDMVEQVVMGDCKLTVRVLMKVGAADPEWLTAHQDNALIMNFWGSGISGEYWLANAELNPIGYEECRTGTPGYNEEAGSSGGDAPSGETGSPDTGFSAMIAVLPMLGAISAGTVLLGKKKKH